MDESETIQMTPYLQDPTFVYLVEDLIEVIQTQIPLGIFTVLSVHVILFFKID